MIIFTKIGKSIDYKDFITQNVHPAPEYNRWGRLACYAYVLSPLTDKIEKKALTIGALCLRDVISQDLYNEIVADYASGRTLEYELVLANFSGYGLQKVKFCVTKK